MEHHRTSIFYFFHIISIHSYVNLEGFAAECSSVINNTTQRNVHPQYKDRVSYKVQYPIYCVVPLGVSCRGEVSCALCDKSQNDVKHSDG